jgi:hypothetical protein
VVGDRSRDAHSGVHAPAIRRTTFPFALSHSHACMYEYVAICILAYPLMFSNVCDVCVCVCVCVCTCVTLCACVRVIMYLCVRVIVYVYLYECVCVCVCARSCVCVCVCLQE